VSHRGNVHRDLKPGGGKIKRDFTKYYVEGRRGGEMKMRKERRRELWEGRRGPVSGPRSAEKKGACRIESGNR